MKELRAEMAGVLVSFSVAAGQAFQAGDEVAVLESMKMQIPIVAPEGGRVAELVAEPGAFVNEGDVLFRYE